MAEASRSQDGNFFLQFLQSQAGGAIILLAVSILAFGWANSPWRDLYHALSELELGYRIGERLYHLELSHWVKDGLMTVFFFVVGLEIKRELLLGELASRAKAMLPVGAALGGAMLPALCYLLATAGAPEARAGWGIPMATDIAFALGILALFGSRVPHGLKVFLTGLAIVDDLLAVLVIAVFYTETIRWGFLAAAAVLLVVLFQAVRRMFRQTWLHLLLALAIWLCVFLSGIHATIAGVLIAWTIPIQAMREPEAFFAELCAAVNRLKAGTLSRRSMVHDRRQHRDLMTIYLAAEEMLPPGLNLEHSLHRLQAFVILPLFAFFAVGVTVDQATMAAFPGPAAWGVLLGLVFGKPLGICGAVWLLVRFRWAALPEGVTWGMLLGVGMLGGIGFTMSIFITDLAFASPALTAEAKLAVFLASILAGVGGGVQLARTLRNHHG